MPAEQRKPTTAMVGEQMISKKGVFGIVQGHANRHLAIDPKDGALFVGVGSSGNIGVEPEVKASIQRFNADGSNQTTFASGLRNATSLAFNPTTGDLYTVVQERDGLGDRLVPDFHDARTEGRDSMAGPIPTSASTRSRALRNCGPTRSKPQLRPTCCSRRTRPRWTSCFTMARSSPTEYRGDAFVALKGSWNRSEPTGYKVVRVPFKDGKPQGFYQNFVTGFWVSGQNRAEVWGRPTALAVMKDGSLLIADDTGGTIWRVSYSGPKQQTGQPPSTTGARPN